jgi:hypothetical protein
MTPRPALRMGSSVGAEDPDAGVVHLDDGADALAGAEEEGLDEGGVGDGVAVERDDLELVAAEGDAAVLDGGGVEEVEEDALAGVTRMGSPAPRALSLME